jgi:hypothetical protein
MRFSFQLVFASFLLSLFAAPASAACLSRDVVAEAGKSEPITVMVADDEAMLLQAKGFAVSSCPMDAVSQAQYRDEICRAASEGNSAVQLRLTEVLGESPAWLCASAKRLLSSLAQDSSSNDSDTQTPTEPTPADEPAATPPQ